VRRFVLRVRIESELTIEARIVVVAQSVAAVAAGGDGIGLISLLVGGLQTETRVRATSGTAALFSPSRVWLVVGVQSKCLVRARGRQFGLLVA
jgi:hypothetical protein